MNDSDLIRYCDIHCESERALFSVSHINRMITLAGLSADRKMTGDGFYSMHTQMKDLVRLAELKRKKPTLRIVK